jgi:hypothetical protein
LREAKSFPLSLDKKSIKTRTINTVKFLTNKAVSNSKSILSASSSYQKVGIILRLHISSSLWSDLILETQWKQATEEDYKEKRKQLEIENREAD